MIIEERKPGSIQSREDNDLIQVGTEHRSKKDRKLNRTDCTNYEDIKQEGANHDAYNK